MADNSATNGAEGTEPRERPSWYVSSQPIPESDTRTGQEVLLDTFGHDPPELPDDVQDELLAYLNRFRVPRDS